MRLAILADIHGNDLALEAVLGDSAILGADHIINLGDAFNGPIGPSNVARTLRGLGAVHLRGNGDRMVLDAEHGGWTWNWPAPSAPDACETAAGSMPKKHSQQWIMIFYGTLYIK